MARAITALLILVGIIHLLPLSGILGAERLAALYGIAVHGPDLEILMRHRAVLFGLLGSLLVYAAFKPPLQALAIAAALPVLCHSSPLHGQSAIIMMPSIGW